MTYDDFKECINNLELRILEINEDCWAIKNKNFANPMLFFNPNLKKKDYNGNVSVKAFNISLYTESEIKAVLRLVNELLMTKVSKRGEK